MKIMLDNNILSLAEVAQFQYKKIDGHKNELLILKSKPRNKNKNKAAQIEALPTIANLAREGEVELFISSEVMEESWRNPNSFPSHRMTNIIENDLLSWVRNPIRRDNIMSGPLQKEQEKLVRFVVALLALSKIDLSKRTQFFGNTLTQRELSNLEKSPSINDICKSLSQKHYADAFHLWTSSVSEMDVFLTADQKFRNAVYQNPDAARWRFAAVELTMLLNILGKTIREPMPYEYNKEYSIY